MINVFLFIHHYYYLLFPIFDGPETRFFVLDPFFLGSFWTHIGAPSNLPISPLTGHKVWPKEWKPTRPKSHLFGLPRQGPSWLHLGLPSAPPSEHVLCMAHSHAFWPCTQPLCPFPRGDPWLSPLRPHLQQTPSPKRLGHVTCVCTYCLFLFFCIRPTFHATFQLMKLPFSTEFQPQFTARKDV